MALSDEFNNSVFVETYTTVKTTGRTKEITHNRTLEKHNPPSGAVEQKCPLKTSNEK